MKKTIMLFAGTTEGRRICEFLAVKKCITHVYVTTEYGKEQCAYTCRENG